MHEQEKDLFAGYEIKNWNITTRIYKIIGASAIINLLFVFVIAQGNLLTRKGCDSPFVSSICQVLDTVYVSSMILGTDRDYVDKAYEKTDLGDAEITYIDVSGDSPPLKYPDRYFALANPEQAAMMQDPTIAAMPQGFENSSTFGGFSGATAIPPVNGSPSNDLLATKPTLPPVVDNPIVGKLPTSTSGSSNPIASYPKARRGGFPRGIPVRRSPTLPDVSPKELPKLGGDQTAINKPKEEKKPEASPTPEAANSNPVTAVEINKRPIKDLGAFINDLLAKKEIDLQSDFAVGARGKLTKDGKLDPKTFKYTQAQAADPKMIEVIRQSIEAINESGYLQYLSQLSGKDLTLLMQQDGANLTATVQSELENENRAKSIKSGLDFAISIAKMTKTDPNDKDDLDLLKSATIESKGKQIIIKFAIPKPLAQDMIKRKLLDEATKAAQEPPSGTAQNANANKNAK